MRLTTKGRFAVTAMLDMALVGSDEPVKLGQISQRHNISVSYLEQLFARLRRAGLVTSLRGPGGGYRIALPLENISVADIVVAADEPIDATHCEGRQDCHDGHACLTHDVWVKVTEALYASMSAITLAQVIADAAHKRERGHVVRMLKMPELR